MRNEKTVGPPEASGLLSSQTSAEATGRYGLAWALAVFVATRLLVLIVAYWVPQHRDRADRDPGWSPTVPLVRWDGGHYLRILVEGYPRGEPTSDVIAFFPGYSLATRPLALFMDAEVALVVMSHLCSLAGMILLYLWSRRHTDPRTAFWCVTLLSAYPPSMFLSAAYADCLLFLCVAAIFCLLDRGQVFAAAGVSALATLTRPTGLAIAAVVWLWAFFGSALYSWRRRLAYLLLIGCVAVSGCIAYQLYLWHHYGRPDAFFAAQSNWESSPAKYPIVSLVTLKPVLQPLFRPIKYAFRGQWDRFFDPERVWNPAFSFVVLVLAFRGLVRPGRVARLLYMLPIFIFLMGYLLDPFKGGRLLGIGRYQIVALPCFLMLAGWVATRWPAVLRYAFIAAMLALQCWYVYGFVDWRLVG